ncbi:keratin-associated protein 27-1 [Moschus berezovskii]|uniref:keratin-associated protein 27-1 n=1 Tax=Moschus berezovskii TaxID=68408 RepID=UPI0024452947|nr:keratin-associated protein 27-1 [Moschus berezovskii]
MNWIFRTACGVPGTNSIKDFHSMTQRPLHPLKNFYNAPPLSAIIHESNVINFEDGFFLPSSCYSRTWLLDNFPEPCRETTSCIVPEDERELHSEESYVQNVCLSRVIQTTSSNSRPYEKTACQSRSSSAVLECASQPCQSGSSQEMSSVVQSCQSVSNMAKSCPPKTYVSKSCQTLECHCSQCQAQSPEPSSCSPLVYVTPESQLLETSSNTHEPTCCVTGGL